MINSWDNLTSPPTEELLAFLKSWKPKSGCSETQYRNCLYSLLDGFVQQRTKKSAIAIANPDPGTASDQLEQEPVQNEPRIDGFGSFSEDAANAPLLKPDLSVGRLGIELKIAPMKSGEFQRALGQAWLYMRACELDTLIVAIIGQELPQRQSDGLATLLTESADYGKEWHLIYYDGNQWNDLACGGQSFDAGGECNIPNF
jgi:hypothetical protein